MLKQKIKDTLITWLGGYICPPPQENHMTNYFATEKHLVPLRVTSKMSYAASQQLQKNNLLYERMIREQLTEITNKILDDKLYMSSITDTTGDSSTLTTEIIIAID